VILLQALGFIFLGFCLGLVDRIFHSVFRHIHQWRQYRWQREQQAKGVPLWEILKDKRYRS
jgi:hypothetical protein